MEIWDLYDEKGNKTRENPADLRKSLQNLTRLIYQELEGYNVPVTQKMLPEYYDGLRRGDEA